MMHDTEAHRNMSEAQHAAITLRRLLRAMGAADDLLRRIAPRDDMRGTAYVYVPALPVPMVRHLVNLLPVPPESGR